MNRPKSHEILSIEKSSEIVLIWSKTSPVVQNCTKSIKILLKRSRLLIMVPNHLQTIRITNCLIMFVIDPNSSKSFRNFPKLNLAQTRSLFQTVYISLELLNCSKSFPIFSRRSKLFEINQNCLISFEIVLHHSSYFKMSNIIESRLQFSNVVAHILHCFESFHNVRRRPTSSQIVSKSIQYNYI